MRVALDATPVIVGRTGISIYVVELAAALERCGVDVRLFAVRHALAPVPPHCKRLHVPARIVHRSWARGGPPRPERLVGPVDVVHATGTLPPPSRMPVVATVHDLAALDHPELHAPRLVRQTAMLLSHLDRATVVVADSMATADALERHGVNRDRVVVSYPGRRPLPEPAPDRVVAGPFLLAVGEQMPRKGLPMLLDAFAAADLDGVALVHAGPASSQTQELVAHADRLGIAERIHWLGYVDDRVLAALLRDAIALCYPSVAEGFGLPVVEAMEAGTPVVASDIASVREIAGDGALLVEPTDRAAWSAALECVTGDDAVRQRLVSNGRCRANQFTWERCARSTIEAYERALGRP